MTMATMGWAAQSQEWNEIGDELVEKWEQAGKPYGKEPTAFQISLEQRKRMLARGQRPLEYEEILDELRGSHEVR
jgi:hypothetical protein